MRWIRRLLGADTPHEVGQRTPEVPLFDRDTPRMETTPARPFVCRVVSSSERGMTYTVEVDETDKWTCTCPDYAHERAGAGRSRYFCKHCIRVGYVTGLKQPRRWRRQRGEGWLIGEMVALDNGSRMKVDGFVTSRELYEVHDMTTAQIQRFLPTPDEEALFHSSDGESGSGCALYTENRVNDVLNSVEYRAEREKTERRREAARKGSVKQAETRARKRAIAEKARAEARTAFGGGIYLARCVYTYGWQEYGVYAKDAEHAQSLMEQWLRSDDGQSEMTTLHADAVSNYQSAMEDYRDARKDYRDEKEAGVSDEELGLSRPQAKPKKTEFKLSVKTITKSNLDTKDFEIEEVQFHDASDGWDHDINVP